MELRARTLPLPRRAAWMAALVALIASAVAAAIAPSADAATKKRAPVITSVAPTNVSVGGVLTIKGRHFLRGRSRNTVVFKRDGARAVFAKAGISTRKMMQIQVPGSLQEFFSLNAGEPVPTRFRLRVLARKFGKTFTTDGLSPIVFAPRPSAAGTPGAAASGGGAPKVEPPIPAPADGDCDGDGSKNTADRDDDNDGLTDDVELSLSLDPCVADTDKDGRLDKWEFDCDRNEVLNRDQADDDSDLLSDDTETAIGTNPCMLDTDGDGVEDGFEYQSAKDWNDDSYQNPNLVLPYPGKRPYPNPLFVDASRDYDGDSLSLENEQMLWKYTYTTNHTAARTLAPLSYSDGLKNSRPNQPFSTYPMQQHFLNWASASGHLMITLRTGRPAYDAPVGIVNGDYEIRDVDLDHEVEPNEANPADYNQDGMVNDAERDEDADGLSNHQELRGPMHAGYWSGCYSMEGPYLIEYDGTRPDDADSDGDGVLDGADDQDADDVPNLMELSRIASSHQDDREAGVVCKVDASLLVPKDLDNDGKPDAQVSNHPNAYGRVNPFNPCLPFTDSRTCPDFREIGGSDYAPFDLSVNWVALH
jgi:hypothetical protein